MLAVGLICMKTCNLNSETQSVCYAEPHLNLEEKMLTSSIRTEQFLHW